MTVKFPAPHDWILHEQHDSRFEVLARVRNNVLAALIAPNPSGLHVTQLAAKTRRR